MGVISYMELILERLHPMACKDGKGRLRVAAGVGITDDAIDRVSALAAESVDAVVLDCAHGHSRRVIDLLKKVKVPCPDIDVVVGKVATEDAARMLGGAAAEGVILSRLWLPLAIA